MFNLTFYSIVSLFFLPLLNEIVIHFVFDLCIISSQYTLHKRFNAVLAPIWEETIKWRHNFPLFLSLSLSLSFCLSFTHKHFYIFTSLHEQNMFKQTQFLAQTVLSYSKHHTEKGLMMLTLIFGAIC